MKYQNLIEIVYEYGVFIRARKIRKYGPNTVIRKGVVNYYIAFGTKLCAEQEVWHK